LDSRPQTNKQSGFSLASVMLAAGLGTIVVIAMVKSLSSISATQSFQEFRTDRESLRLSLLTRVDCAKTFPVAGAPACAATGSYIDLLDSAGKVVLAAAGTTSVGIWQVRAKCASTGLDIRVASLLKSAPASALAFEAKATSAFRAEPSSKVPLDWSHPKSPLFASTVQAPCAARFSPPTPSSSSDCAPGQVVVGYSPVNGINCRAIGASDLASVGTCGSGLYLAGFNAGGRDCRALPTPTSTIVTTSTVSSNPTPTPYSPPNPPTPTPYSPPNPPAPTPPNPPTPPTPSGPTRNGGGRCTLYSAGPCAGHCGGGPGCASTWNFSGAGQPGGCSPPNYMTNEVWVYNSFGVNMFIGYECWKP
jgi:hypothetical protein